LILVSSQRSANGKDAAKAVNCHVSQELYNVYGGVDIMHITDMVMHVDNRLGADTRRTVEKALTRHRGVIHAHFNEARPHLMLVSYDKERTSSFEILAQMTGQQLCAERVG
jgi:hypothetical protein